MADMAVMLGSAVSRNGFRIRLTHERWSHVVESHDYLAGLHEWVLETIADPDTIALGWEGSLMATRHYPSTPITEKHMIVVYRELHDADGFVITAFMTSRVDKVWQRGLLWQR